MKKLPFFAILSVLLFLAVVAIIAFPTTKTTHIQGTAETWDKEDTYLGTCPVEIDIREVKSLCFRYRSDISLLIDGQRIPPLPKIKNSIYYQEYNEHDKFWSGLYYDPTTNGCTSLSVDYHTYTEVPEYEIRLRNRVYRLRDFTVS